MISSVNNYCGAYHGKRPSEIFIDDIDSLKYSFLLGIDDVFFWKIVSCVSLRNGNFDPEDRERGKQCEDDGGEYFFDHRVWDD